MIEITEIAKLTILPDEVLLIKVNRNNLPIDQYKTYINELRYQMKEFFPESRIMVYDDTINMSIVKFIE